MSSLSKKIILSLSALFLVLIFSTNQTFAARTLNFTELGTHPEAAAQTRLDQRTVRVVPAQYGVRVVTVLPAALGPPDQVLTHSTSRRRRSMAPPFLFLPNQLEPGGLLMAKSMPQQ